MHQMQRRIQRLACAALCAVAASAGAATLTVTNADGTDTEGSLIRAIRDANATPEHDSIVFAIPGDGVHTIALAARLPDVTAPLLIDGYTQPGAAVATATTPAVLRIAIDGSATDFFQGLSLHAPGSRVRGLAIGGFLRSGVASAIRLGDVLGPCDGCQVDGCHLGTDAAGSVAHANARGIFVSHGSGSLVGGPDPAHRNIIAGNQDTGILVSDASTVTIQGNHIGVAADGNAALGNGGFGVTVFFSDDVVLHDNLVMHNGAGGIQAGSEATAVDLRGNRFAGNVGLGIDHVPAGETPGLVTPNVTDDTGAHPNFPELDEAAVVEEGLRVRGALDHAGGEAAFASTISLWSNTSCDPSGHGEGERYLGEFPVVFGEGDDTFELVLAADAAEVGSAIVAAATSAKGTSEFSPCVVLTDAVTILRDGFEGE